MSTKNACLWWDFTISKEKNGDNTKNITDYLEKHCDVWCFQEEEGIETKYRHYQGRLKRLIKTRNMIGEIAPYVRWSPTSKPNINCFDYVTKDHTYIEGTRITSWDVENEDDNYIPRQFKNIGDNLKPFQKTIKESANTFDTCSINAIYEPEGGKGKSSIAHYMRLFENGICLPCVNDAKELIQSCCNMLTAKRLRKNIVIFIDLPKAMNKERLSGLFTAIEQIKSGYVFDMRNKYKEWNYDSPTIWVFSNNEFETDLLTNRRWKLWEINDKMELIPTVKKCPTYRDDIGDMIFFEEGAKAVTLPQKKLKIKKL